MDTKSKIILIAGPTASGKSKFAVQLANKIDGEIINADSMQVYKELKILTARPKKIDQKNIKHHLYGFLSVKKKFSTGAWLKLVIKKIKEIKKKNKVPILVGGTGLYFKTLTEGMVSIPNITMKNRNKIITLQKKIGQKNFYKKLLNLDPLIKNYIDANDVQRSIRAYEIKFFLKKSIIKWQQNTKAFFDLDDFIKIYIDFPRDILVDKIKSRVEDMFRQGAVAEVKKFMKLKIKKINTANKIIGIKEISKYLSKDFDLDQAKEKIFIKTRQYAKRQNTWARGQMMTWQKIEPNDLTNTLKKFK